MRPDVDVLVAGGGPVGLAVAIEARLAGLRTVVVEPRATPIDKACGEGLMPGAVADLAALGVSRVSWALYLYFASMAHFEEQLRSLR